MTFTSDFEDILNEYDIHVSDRTRRLIRRNYAKMIMDKQGLEPKRTVFFEMIYIVWRYINFILSVIFKITIRIMSGIACLCAFLAKLTIEIYCVCLIATIMKAVIQQYRLN
jgi:hypothetical protein